MNEYKVKITFLEDLLGTAPLNKELYTQFIASKTTNVKAAEEEESTIVEADDKGCTGFHVNEKGQPFLYDYMIKGFCKDACGMLRKVEKTLSSKMAAHKKKIDGLLFIRPRRLLLQINGELSTLERPLRAQTPKGERISLAKSQIAPAGTSIEFTILTLGNEISEEILKEWLNYGVLRGIGQWRNASYGSFNYTITKGKKEVTFADMASQKRQARRAIKK